MRQMYSMGVLSVFVVLITGAFTGMVLTVQSYYQLHTFTLDTIVAPIVGLSMTREIGPVLTGLILAGRVGASITAEIGTMKVTEQIDALDVFGISPIAYLVVPRLLACVVLIPFLSALAICIGIFSSYLFSTYFLNIPYIFYIVNLKSFVFPFDILIGLLKTVFFGMIIVLVSCYKGFYTAKGSEGVGKAVMETVVTSFICILLVDLCLSMILF